MNMLTKFGEGSMYTLGAMLRTKCAGHTHGRTDAGTHATSLLRGIKRTQINVSLNKQHFYLYKASQSWNSHGYDISKDESKFTRPH